MNLTGLQINNYTEENGEEKKNLSKTKSKIIF